MAPCVSDAFANMETQTLNGESVDIPDSYRLSVGVALSKSRTRVLHMVPNLSSVFAKSGPYPLLKTKKINAESIDIPEAYRPGVPN